MDQDIHSDESLVFEFETAVAAGKYVFRVQQVGEKGESDTGRYSVLPAYSSMAYDTTYLEYGSLGEFGLVFQFQKTEGVSNYLLLLNDDVVLETLEVETIVERSGDIAIEFNDREFAILTPLVPDEQVLYRLSITSSPTWSNKNGDSDVRADVYKWLGDYDSTYLSTPVLTMDLTNRQDGADLTFIFGTALRYGYQYLIVINATNYGKIGFWEGEMVAGAEEKGWKIFCDCDEADSYPSMKAQFATVGDLGPEPTVVPTEETASAEATATPEVTKETEETAAQATEAQPTEAQTEETEKPGTKSGCGSIVISGFAVLALMCGAVISKKRK